MTPIFIAFLHCIMVAQGVLDEPTYALGILPNDTVFANGVTYYDDQFYNTNGAIDDGRTNVLNPYSFVVTNSSTDTCEIFQTNWMGALYTNNPFVLYLKNNPMLAEYDQSNRVMKFYSEPHIHYVDGIIIITFTNKQKP